MEWQGAESVVVAERPKPLITDPKDALIRITATTICGSDLHMWFDKVPGVKVLRKGDILGHECMIS